MMMDWHAEMGMKSVQSQSTPLQLAKHVCLDLGQMQQALALSAQETLGVMMVWNAKQGQQTVHSVTTQSTTARDARWDMKL